MLVGAQAVGLLAAAVFYVVELVVATADDAVRAPGQRGAGAGRGGRASPWSPAACVPAAGWARSPALVTNLLVCRSPWGCSRAAGGTSALPLLALAVAVLVLLFHPSTSDALDED